MTSTVEKQELHQRAQDSSYNRDDNRNAQRQHGFAQAANFCLHVVKTLVNPVKASVNLFEATVYLLETLLKMLLNLLEALVDVRKALFHALVNIEKTLVHAVEALVGKFIHVVETFVHAPDELTELLHPDVFVRHVVSPWFWESKLGALRPRQIDIIMP